MDNGVIRIAEELVVASKRAYNRGIQTGSGGNVSARIPDANLMLVKASGSSFIDSTIEGFLITDFEGNVVEGKGCPTREALLHGLLYRCCPNVNAVVHTHSVYSIAWASVKKALPRVTWHSRLKMSADLPIFDVPAPIVPPEFFPEIENAFRENPELNGFLLVDHGLVALGKDPISAEHVAELIEETAQVAIWKNMLKK